MSIFDCLSEIDNFQHRNCSRRILHRLVNEIERNRGTMRKLAYLCNICCDFNNCKNDNFSIQNVIVFLFLLKRRLWVQVRTTSMGNEYPQSMFENKTTKIMYTFVNSNFTII